MTTMTTRLLLYTAQKGCFKNFKYEKQMETLEFYFSCIVDSMAITLLKYTILRPDSCVPITTDAFETASLLSYLPFSTPLHYISLTMASPAYTFAGFPPLHLNIQLDHNLV
jgi:hypothetical protein